VRVEVFYRARFGDGRARRLLDSLRNHQGLGVSSCAIVDAYLLDRPPADPRALSALSDSVAQESRVDVPAADEALPAWDTLIEVTARPGVADPVASSAAFALQTAALEDRGIGVQSAQQYLFRHTASSGESARALRAALAASLHNPLIQQATVVGREEWTRGARLPARYEHDVPPSPSKVETIDIDGMDGDALASLSRRRLLALSVEEMRAIQAHFRAPEVMRARARRGLPAAPTDVELEMLAQTWSEHCKHKIFNALIRYRDADRDGDREGGNERVVDSVFATYIRGTTDAMTEKRDFLVSVFSDNSGVVRFDDETLLCLKVETHNSPSALDPYGGAITGIVGVNRDIIGTGLAAKPIFNTNVLCFGDPATPAAELPPGLLPPARVMAGVHRGIVDGGNQSGIPVVAGAFLFDPSYAGKPLVFCGTGGILPARCGDRPGEAGDVRPGDLAVMAGGRIGKDGIHGATFSSEGLHESSPTSAVQIGDPITQKKMLDLILEARDLDLFRGLTDNGAGGLSSSLGEMARKSGGVRIDLDAAPLKYPGLAAWEILVSESQERMSLAVPPERLPALEELARRRDVEVSVVGCFTGDGVVDVRWKGSTVALIDLEFLHDGLPRMRLDAVWTPPVRSGAPPARLTDHTAILLRLLGDPNIASKEGLIRQYDEEVKAQSVVKPFVGAREDGPSDGAVLRPRFDSWRGITVTHGICPRYGDLDTYDMATCAADEAVRAHVACGGDPDQMCALDNTCWPDPVASAATPDGPYKLAQLVRAMEGLRDACLAFRLPLISGKDSMKNDSMLGGRKVSVRPTLLVTLMGIVPDVREAVTTDCKRPGDLVYLVGETRGELGGTSLERLLGASWPRGPRARPDEAMRLYRALHRAVRAGAVASLHDVSDGGLAVSLFESAFGGRLGVAVDFPAGGLTPVELLFSETPSRLVATVRPDARGRFESSLAGLPFARVGVVLAEPRLTMRVEGETLVDLDLETGGAAWKIL
jgi:phosphoribosylformylglycinamidine synthase subunit PurSL